MTVWIDNTYLPNIGVTVLVGGVEPALPSTRDKSVTIPGKHGAYVFSNDLDVRQFEIPCAISGIRDHNLISSKVRQIARLFTDNYGRPKTVKLRFDTEPDRFYYVRFSGNLPIDKIAYTAKFSLNLTAFDPIAKSTRKMDEEITLDSDVSVLSDYTLEADFSFNITSAKTITVVNSGTIAVKPTITINGSATTVKLSVNGKSFTLSNFSNKTFVINCEAYTTTINGANSLSQMAGDFIDLIPGNNSVSVTGTDLDIDVSFSYYNQYL